MSEWKEYRLGDICQTNKSQYSAKENWENFHCGLYKDNKLVGVCLILIKKIFT